MQKNQIKRDGHWRGLFLKDREGLKLSIGTLVFLVKPLTQSKTLPF
jgi:hypothetical protein